MPRISRIALLILSFALACPAPAPAIQTNEVELGLASSYDGTVKLRRDAEGRLVFVDNQVTTPVTLGELLSGAGGAFANAVTVAVSGGQHADLASAYAAVPDGGIVLVYPGTYAFPTQLVLGSKSCAFVAFDSGATTLDLAAPIIVGYSADATGGEDWDSTTPYLETGHHSFDGFRFAAPSSAAILIKRANMASGSLRLSRCRFEGAQALATARDATAGFSTSLHINVADCEFWPVDHATKEIAISLCNNSRAGAAAGRYLVRDSLFNPAPLALAAPFDSAASYGVGVELLGSVESALLRGNTFLDVIESVRVAGLDHQTLQADANLILFRNDLTGFTDPRVAGFTFAPIAGDFSALLSSNRVLIEDATTAPCETYAVHSEFGSATANAIVARGNQFKAAGGGTSADLAESATTAAYDFESTDDIWTAEAISVGSLTLGASGKRKLLALEIPSLVAGAVLYAGSGGLVSGDNDSLHYDSANKGLVIGASGDAEVSISGTATPYSLGLHSEGSRDALQAVETNSDLHSPGVYFFRSKGSAASKSAVAGGNMLGSVAGLGYDGTDYKAGGLITFIAGTPSGGVVPTDIGFFVLPNGYAQYIRSDGAVEVVKNLGVGTGSFGASAEQVIGIADGAAPTSSPAGMVQLFAELTTGTVELQVRDEAGNVTTLSPHTFKLFQPRAEDPLPFSYYSKNPYIGKEINVDVSGAIAEIERLSGKKFIHVRDLPDSEREDWDANQRANAETAQARRPAAQAAAPAGFAPAADPSPAGATADDPARGRVAPGWIRRRLP